ncbi:MAG: hypothetical protein HUU56_04390, partial [Bdellovibrionaceae bacterium]|nr:hypothetical protein [Pseudobdellovibrionaceae bacterium]
MKAIIVTSQITFVPENYDRFVLKMAEHPHVLGLIVLKNRDPLFLLKATYLILSGAAPRLGFQVFKNYLSSFTNKRTNGYKKNQKKIWFLDTINSSEAIKIVEEEKVDLIVNARTRYIYKKSILNIPRYGCINIHHGLLPNQRGLMCDFWAHLEGEKFGFSIHKMTSKIDDGDILKVIEVKSSKNNYLESLLVASQQEAHICGELLHE